MMVVASIFQGLFILVLILGVYVGVTRNAKSRKQPGLRRGY